MHYPLLLLTAAFSVAISSTINSSPGSANLAKRQNDAVTDATNNVGYDIAYNPATYCDKDSKHVCCKLDHIPWEFYHTEFYPCNEVLNDEFAKWCGETGGRFLLCCKNFNKEDAKSSECSFSTYYVKKSILIPQPAEAPAPLEMPAIEFIPKV